jgi:hypothetical protein
LYISYVDDSGSSGTNLEDRQVPFQVIGGPLIEDTIYSRLQLALATEIFNLVPRDDWESFEFHAADLFRAKPPFDRLGAEKCGQLLERALGVIKEYNLPVICGSVDKANLKTQLYRTADPADMAFELYLQSLQEWLEKNSTDQFSVARGLLICDDVRLHKQDDSRKDDPERKGDLRYRIEQAFRRNKTRPISISFDNNIEKSAGIDRFSTYLFDDIYFGDSKNSIGLQLADICVYFVARNLASRSDSRGFYDIIKDQLVLSKI